MRKPEEIIETVETVKELEEKVAEQEYTILGLEADVTLRDERIKELEDRLSEDKFLNGMPEVEAENGRLKVDIVMKHQAIQELKERIAELEQELESEKTYSGNMEVLNLSRADEIRELEAQLKERDINIENLEKETATNQREIEQLDSLCNTHVEQVWKLKKELEAYKKMWAEIRTDIETYSEEDWKGQSKEWLDEVEDKYLPKEQEPEEYTAKVEVDTLDEEWGDVLDELADVKKTSELIKEDREVE